MRRLLLQETRQKRNRVAKTIASEYHPALHTLVMGGVQEWRSIVISRCQNSANPLSVIFKFRFFAATAVVCSLWGCSSPRDSAWDEFARWHDGARAQAQAGSLSWSDLYKQSFDRLAALPSSFQQDKRLENTVLLLSTARKFEANEINAQQFALQRTDIETQLQAPLH